MLKTEEKIKFRNNKFYFDSFFKLTLFITIPAFHFVF